MLYLHAAGHFHPEIIIDNAFLESLDYGISQEWILERVGIATRRSVLPREYIKQTRNQDVRAAAEASLYSNTEVAVHAARMALTRANLTPSDIGLVIASSCSPELTIPAEACRIAAALGIEAPAFDLNAACASFGLQLHFVNSMQPAALPEFILLVNTETNTRTVDYNDYRSAVLWGDGASAVIVSPRVASRARVCYTSYSSDPSGWDNVTIPSGGHFRQNGAAVQHFAIKKMLAIIACLREQMHEQQQNSLYIGHQANLTMLRSVCERAGIPAARHRFNVDRFGNCGAAGAPSVLSQCWETLEAGTQVMMAVVGSGLAWGGELLEFTSQTHL